MYKLKMVVGDWSDDGHGKSDFVYFDSSVDSATIKKAYLKACKQSGVYLHDTGSKQGLLCSYEDKYITTKDIKKLSKIGIDANKYEPEDEREADDAITIHDPKTVCKLFLDMVGSQLPDFSYQILSDDIECINGFWSKDFNYGIGYGIYD